MTGYFWVCNFVYGFFKYLQSTCRFECVFFFRILLGSYAAFESQSKYSIILSLRKTHTSCGSGVVGNQGEMKSFNWNMNIQLLTFNYRWITNIFIAQATNSYAHWAFTKCTTVKKQAIQAEITADMTFILTFLRWSSKLRMIDWQPFGMLKMLHFKL